MSSGSPEDRARGRAADAGGEAGAERAGPDGAARAGVAAAGRGRPPGAGRPRSTADTPLMRQYLEVKERYPEALVLFHLGDFYELFFEDAVVAARALDLTLTSRDKDSADPIPMAGVPRHAARNYIARLLELGHRVALCDQMEDPRLARGLVKREVTQVITPGVVLDPDQLDARAPNFLCAVAPEGERAGLGWLDLSTGEFRAAAVEGADALADELSRVGPREVIVPPGARAAVARAAPAGCVVAEAPDAFPADAAGALAELGEDAPAEDLLAAPEAARAAAAALRYARATQPLARIGGFRLVVTRPAQHMALDESTVVNLELVESLGDRRRKGSLLWVIDRTVTAMGARLLRHWLLYPLIDVAAIRRRHDAVAHLCERSAQRAALREALEGVSDLERLGSRAAAALATPRELAALGRSLARLPRLREVLAADPGGLSGTPDLLRPGGDDLADLCADIAAALRDEPAPSPAEGAVVREGFSADLDELRALADGGRERILAIEARERERTGIASLKVRYNQVFGYYLEVTKANLKNVPADYTRKQTTANAERFVTPELAEHEAAVLSAEERRVALETRLFSDLRGRVAAAGARLSAVAAAVARADAIASLAEVAASEGYLRPELDESGVIDLRESRHPVVETLAERGRFVPNDVLLDCDGGRMVIVTGPNMAGKSTVMRQVALAAILAQMGGFVPASAARLGVVDRVFTRIGATDNLARGESTFMVEMREVAHILRRATRRSLVVLDEVGRGTATYDGISIAWAVAEYLHDRVGCRTLFATHYHELCALADTRAHVRNANVTVAEQRGEVVFLHRLAPGGASRSYGIQVARLAGLPPSVVARARTLLASLEQGGGGPAGPPAHGAPDRAPQLDLFAGATAPPGLVDALRAVDPDRLTPIEALGLIAEWKGKLLT